MSIFRHYLETATALIADYKGGLPFHLYLRQFFAAHRKYGSRDRKLISALCYHFFRLGHALESLLPEEKMIAAFYLGEENPSGLLAFFNTRFNENIALPFAEKITYAGFDFKWTDIFPFHYLLSPLVDPEAYCRSILEQPDIFIRVRPGKHSMVEKKLAALGWQFNREALTCFRLGNGLPVEKHFDLNRDLVVQDKNSQSVGNIIKAVFDANNFHPKEMWDCCAASGGKSIMMHDLFGGLQITVSDIRPGILKNLETRFREAGITAKHHFVADISKQNAKLPIKSFSFILADVPCSGSGTWARTPEQLYYFDEKIAVDYALRQQAITGNAVQYLTKGGWFVYITCSVFEKENEAMVDRLVKENALSLVSCRLLDGTNDKCDSMFIAVFRADN